MPVVHKNDLKLFTPATRLPKEQTTRANVYHYKEQQTADEVVGDGIFSGVSNLVAPAVKLISSNKDIIANAAKGAAAIGGLAAIAQQVARSNKELKQLDAIKKLREEAAAQVATAPKISNEAKQKVASIGAATTSKGDGIVKF